MLRIITGRAGAGKTSGIMEELRADIAAGLAGRLLLVPEQFSHEAERELAHAAGPGLALCAEVLSFTGLARRLEAEAGRAGGARSPRAGGCCAWRWPWTMSAPPCASMLGRAARRRCSSSSSAPSTSSRRRR